jgi:hypothetical protein
MTPNQVKFLTWAVAGALLMPLISIARANFDISSLNLYALMGETTGGAAAGLLGAWITTLSPRK